MKRIIFSSVCAVALFSVSANATSIWETRSTEQDNKITEALAALKGATGTAGTNYDKYFNAYKTKVSDTVAAKNKLDEAKKALGSSTDKAGDSLYAKQYTTGKTLLGSESDEKATDAASATSLYALLKFYQGESNKEAEVADVNKAIEEVRDGKKITATLAGATGLGTNKSAYTEAQGKVETAVTNLGTDKDEDTSLHGLYNKAQKAEATAKSDLDIAQVELDNEVAQTKGAAKLQAKFAEEIAIKKAYDDAVKTLGKYNTAKDAFDAAKSDRDAAKSDLGVLKDEKGKPTGKYLKLDQANAGLQAAQTAVIEKTQARDEAKTKLLGSAPSAFASDAKLADQTSLKALAKFYEVKKDTEDTDGKKLAAVQAVIKAVENGEKVPVKAGGSDDGKVILTPAKGDQAEVLAEVKWDDIKGGVAATDFEKTVSELAGAESTLGVEKGADGKPSGAYKTLAEAKAELQTAQDKLATEEGKLAKAQGELAEAKAGFNAAKADTVEGKVIVAKVEKNIGADLASVAGGSVKQLAGLLLDDNAVEIPVARSKEKANAENATDADKEEFNEIQAAANAVAGAALEGKKEAVMSSSLGTLNVQINNMNKRLGEIRGLEGEVGTWFRAYGGRYSTDNDHFNYYSTQIGADKITNIGNGDLIVGALFGFDKVNADTSSKTYSFGGYLSYVDNGGFFADTVLKFGKTKHSKDGYNIKNQNIFLASFEGGYRVNVSDSFYVEPSLELITGRIGKYEAKTNNTTITVDSFTPFVIKPQVFAGYSVNDFILRVGGGYVYNSKRQDATLRINEIVKDLSADAKVKLDKNNYGFASIGGSYKFTDNLRLNLGVERSFGGKLTQDYELNATIRYTF